MIYERSQGKGIGGKSTNERKSGSAVWSATGRKPIVRSGSGKSADRCIQPGTDRCIWPATDESAEVRSAGLRNGTGETADVRTSRK